MKKGDLRKQEILITAEQLFCQKGYEQTSIQDILDQLKTSKGSFYHHFVSKESLLETICSNRASQSLEIAVKDSTGLSNAAQKLNHFLSGMIPLHDEKLSFILMLLPTFILPDGKSLKTSYCESLKNHFVSVISDTIKEGNLSGEMVCTDSDLCADIVISIVNKLWIKICDIIIENEMKGSETEISELLHLTEQYRSAVERILSLVYGTLVLIDISSLKSLVNQIHIHWYIKQTDFHN